MFDCAFQRTLARLKMRMLSDNLSIGFKWSKISRNNRVLHLQKSSCMPNSAYRGDLYAAVSIWFEHWGLCMFLVTPLKKILSKRIVFIRHSLYNSILLYTHICLFLQSHQFGKLSMSYFFKLYNIILFREHPATQR